MSCKICTRCRADKPVEEFPKQNHRRGSWCRGCVAKYKREYTNRPGNKRRLAAYHRQRLYGITQDAFDTLMQVQHELCAVCFRPFDQSVSKLRAVVDHDHETGKVRGILHGRCNSGIGYFEDRPALLDGAAAYLRRHGR